MSDIAKTAAGRVFGRVSLMDSLGHIGDILDICARIDADEVVAAILEGGRYPPENCGFGRAIAFMSERCLRVYVRHGFTLNTMRNFEKTAPLSTRKVPLQFILELYNSDTANFEASFQKLEAAGLLFKEWRISFYEILEAFHSGKAGLFDYLLTHCDTSEVGMFVLCWVDSFSIQALENLIADGHDINAKDKAGQTVLYYFVKKPKSELKLVVHLVQLLLDKGADVDYVCLPLRVKNTIRLMIEGSSVLKECRMGNKKAVVEC